MSSKMLFYILKRILLAILTIWIVITVTFFVMHAVPGGPFVGEKAISKEAQAALEAKYGLDKPLLEQYTTYLRDILTRFDFGPSLKQRGRQVIDIILDGSQQTLGTVTSVDLTTINTLFELRTPDGKSLLIPANDDFITDIDRDARCITMRLPEGLLDI